MLSDAVNAVIGDIYRCAFDDSHWQPTLLGLSRMVGGIGAAIVPNGNDSPELRFSSSRITESDQIYYDHMWRHDPYRMHLHGRSRPQGEISDTALVTDAELERHPYYQDFLRKFGAGRTNRLYFADPACPPFSLSVQRPWENPHETDAQRRLRVMLGQHVCRALAMSAAERRSRVLAHGFHEICMRLSTAAALVDQEGRMVFMNDAMSDLMGDGITCVDHRVVCLHRESQRRLDDLLRGVLHPDTATQVAPERFITLQCPSGQPVIARAMPLFPGMDDANMGGRPARGMALVMFHRPGAPTPDVSDALHLLGLNHSEARLARQVGNGLSLKEAARELGISDHYARSILRHVYEKLDVNSQSKLAAFLRDLPAPYAGTRA
ncbi:helix-turn-helix transcriptional regulator [Novacetimonas cocois]|uniref:HTH luxR-type domain-containing protein n=1 Tax=Novacetimonas cocois TaxID=1747507 RepID=A0A365Z0X4_9PROT|nr:helix-turn-helix transcriptional regulator [Novacetimonas cocois]RBM08616.1 hypothetical protein NJLHNGOC_04590 [Novacetimonas cocois]